MQNILSCGQGFDFKTYKLISFKEAFMGENCGLKFYA